MGPPKSSIRRSATTKRRRATGGGRNALLEPAAPIVSAWTSVATTAGLAIAAVVVVALMLRSSMQVDRAEPPHWQAMHANCGSGLSKRDAAICATEVRVDSPLIGTGVCTAADAHALELLRSEWSNQPPSARNTIPAHVRSLRPHVLQQLLVSGASLRGDGAGSAPYAASVWGPPSRYAGATVAVPGANPGTAASVVLVHSFLTAVEAATIAQLFETTPHSLGGGIGCPVMRRPCSDP